MNSKIYIIVHIPRGRSMASSASLIFLDISPARSPSSMPMATTIVQATASSQSEAVIESIPNDSACSLAPSNPSFTLQLEWYFENAKWMNLVSSLLNTHQMLPSAIKIKSKPFRMPFVAWHPAFLSCLISPSSPSHFMFKLRNAYFSSS